MATKPNVVVPLHEIKTDEQRIAMLVRLRSKFGPGDDSLKRKLAIELLVGPPDGLQTVRLAQFAMDFAVLRTLKQP